MPFASQPPSQAGRVGASIPTGGLFKLFGLGMGGSHWILDVTQLFWHFPRYVNATHIQNIPTMAESLGLAFGLESKQTIDFIEYSKRSFFLRNIFGFVNKYD